MGNTASRPSITVNEFDPIKYQGEWWQIASYPNKFEADCVRAKADYKWDDEQQRVMVTNTCYKADGSTYDIKGVAMNINKANPGRLVVKFPNSPPGQYWVHWTNYTKYAIVGNGNRSQLFVLSRSKCITADDYSLLQAAVRGFGYNLNRLTASKYAVGDCDNHDAWVYSEPSHDEIVYCNDDESEHVIDTSYDDHGYNRHLEENMNNHGYHRHQGVKSYERTDTVADSQESGFWHSS